MEIRTCSVGTAELAYQISGTGPIDLVIEMGLGAVMAEHREERCFDQVFADLGEMAEISVAAIQSDYGLSRQEACRLFQHIWVYAFGIGTLCAARVCCFSDEEINDMLGQTFTAFMLLARSGGLNAVTIRPVKDQTEELTHLV